MPVIASFPFVCPWCSEERIPGSLYNLGPDTSVPKGVQLAWDVECLRNFAWLRAEVRFRTRP
jgi:hypothetical protein